MKILAIRGAGLASLSEPFEVALDEGALAQAGVFAIVGPTGAGKSTLLDTLFLALFGDTPRLTNQQRVRLPGRVGEGDNAEGLTTRDARGLARGDARVAYAEVDFLGVDGARYRARWEVRRKRVPSAPRAAPAPLQDAPLEHSGRLGAFRKPVHALVRLGGDGSAETEAQRIGGTKTEVLGHVVARLGLDFDQFRRSVVLAQGEIAAFLHAPDRDRAELLERITGTEIYGEISREIHLETVRQRERVALLRAQLGSASVLDVAERRAAEQALSVAHLDALTAEQARQIDEAEQARHLQALELHRELEEARHKLEQLTSRAAAAQGEREQVAAYRALVGLLPSLQAHQRAEGDVERAVEEVRSQRASLAQALADAESSRAQHAASNLDAQRNADGLAAARVVSAAAAEACAALGPAELSHQQAQARHDDALAQSQRAELEASRARDEERAAHQAIERWEQQNTRWPELGGLVDRWTEPASVIARARQLEVERGERSKERAGRDAQVTELAWSLHRQERALAAGVELAEAARKRLEEGRASLADALEAAESMLDEGGDAGLPPRGAAGLPPRGAAGLAASANPRPASDVPSPSPSYSPSYGPPGRGANSAFLRSVRQVGRDLAPLQRELGGHVVRGEAGSAESDGQGASLAGGKLSLQFVPRMRSSRPPASRTAELSTLLESAGSLRSELSEVQQALVRAHAQVDEVHRAQLRRRRARARDQVDRLRFAEELQRLEGQLQQATALARASGDAVEVALRGHQAADLRAHLRAGEPCEVCGSTEHPLRSASAPARAPLTGTLEEQVVALDELRAQRDAAQHEREALAARHLVLDAAFRMTWGAQGAHDAADEPAVSPAQTETLRVLQSSLGAMLDALESAHREVLDAAARSSAAEQHLRELQRKGDADERALRQAEAQRESIDGVLTALNAEAAALGLPVIAAYAKAERVEVSSFVRAAIEARQAAQQASARSEVLHAQRARAEQERERARTQWAKETALLEQARALAAELLVRKRALEVAQAGEETWLRAVKGTAEERARLEEARRSAEERVLHHRANLSRLEQMASEAEGRLATLRAELGVLLAAVPASNGPAWTGRAWTPDSARALLAGEASKFAEWGRMLEQLDAELGETRAVEAERARRLQAHVAGFEHPWSAALAETHLEKLTTVLEERRRREVALRTELSRCEHLLELDDAARSARADKASALEAAQRELAIWEDLLDALGSADGKKLRVHAQRLTLNALVREASQHLLAIAPRYAIEVVTGGDLAIQVSDRALGGEVRALGALSGGETFLISLALALALRGLTSEQVRIATLFIDEGFGSLDAASLDVVLSALDALESTGRQVGIVSHVPEVKERFAARVEVIPQGGGRSLVQVAT